MSSIDPITTDVLVAGAGPTGLTPAVDLACPGVAVRIIDGAATHFAGSRGKGLQERSLEVVGSDGGHSTVRKTLGVAFDGDSSDRNAMVLGDVEVARLAPDHGYTWIDPQRGMLALTPFRTVSQWQFQAAAGDVGEPTLDEFRRQFDLFTGLDDVTISNPTWLWTYRVSARMAREYRVGRAFLAGDAAHVHPPAGGLGMNTGIQDAYNLGWKLARTLTGLRDLGRAAGRRPGAVAR